MCKIKMVSLYGFNMFDINDRQDEYCLSFYERYFSFNLDFGRDSSYIHQTMLYCIRSFQENNSMIDNDFKNTIDSTFTFAALKEQISLVTSYLDGSLPSSWQNDMKSFCKVIQTHYPKVKHYFTIVRHHGLELYVALHLIIRWTAHSVELFRPLFNSKRE
jgi:hypothetical protein